MNKSKLKKIAALFAAIFLLIGLAIFANALVGNPVSYLLVKHNARNYLEQTYGDTDYVIDDIGYSFKDGSYYVHISSPSSQDTYFSVSYSATGQRGYDSYEYRVLEKQNTADRIDQEYREWGDRILESGNTTFQVDLAGTNFYDAFDRANGWDSGEPGTPVEPWDTPLVLDQVYHIPELAARHGKLTLWAVSDTVTAQEAARILLETRRLMEAGGLSCHSVDFRLFLPRNPDSTPNANKVEVRLMNFPWADIYEEGLVDRVDAAWKETTAYCAYQDAHPDK